MKNKNTFFDKPWALSIQKVLDKLFVSPEKGLSFKEISRRRRKYGSNRIRKIERKSAFLIFISQFKSLMMLVMGLAALISFFLNQIIDGIAIAAAMIINVLIGFLTELKAVRSMEALQKMDRVTTKVLRNGEPQVIPAEEIVPGEIVLLESGDIVPADIRLIEANKFQANESALTGESIPVSKNIQKQKEKVPLAERFNLVFKGTSITRGSGKGVAYATGMNTQLGGISSLVEEAEQEADPLEKRLNQLAVKLIWVIAVIVIITGVGGILAGQETILMLKTAVILGIAAIPEGLIIVSTMALARGMRRMASKNALVRRLSAVQTLGSTNIILADKTGTLTENLMSATILHFFNKVVKISGKGLKKKGNFFLNKKKIRVSNYPIVKKILETGVLCSNASLPENEDENEDKIVGDPMEVALLVAGAKAGITRKNLLKEKPEKREVAFDPEIKMMATFHKNEKDYIVAVKGAPSAVLEKSNRILTNKGEKELSNPEKKKWLKKNNTMAEKGMRVLAFAQKKTSSVNTEPYQDLIFLGLIGFIDPPRAEVKQAIKTCQQAGIRVVMVTGDQIPTAKNIARELNIIKDENEKILEGKDILEIEIDRLENKEKLLKTSIFARVSPEQKLRLIETHKKAGSIVAMTGDGVNDAPALKKADIGIAMGKRGEQIAKESADIILQDDAFSTIVTAVKYGRIIFNNIRKFVVYLFSGNMGEIMIVALASFLGAPIPLLPLQILYINVVNDAFPALALGLGKESSEIMKRPPRDPGETVVTRKQWYAITGYGLLIAVSILGGFWIALSHFKMSEEKSITVVFFSLIFARLWHVFNMRDKKSGFFNNQIVRNIYVWLALITCIGLALLALYIPSLAKILNLIHPGKQGWVLAIGVSLVPYILGQLWIHFSKQDKKN